MLNVIGHSYLGLAILHCSFWGVGKSLIIKHGVNISLRCLATKNGFRLHSVTFLFLLLVAALNFASLTTYK